MATRSLISHYFFLEPTDSTRFFLSVHEKRAQNGEQGAKVQIIEGAQNQRNKS